LQSKGVHEILPEAQELGRDFDLVSGGRSALFLTEGAVTPFSFFGEVLYPDINRWMLGAASCCGGNSTVQGTVKYDTSSVNSTGMWNFLFKDMPGSDWQIDIGSKPLHFALTASDSNTTAGILFRNGKFAGFSISIPQIISGEYYRLDVEGMLFSIYWGGPPDVRISGAINSTLL